MAEAIRSSSNSGFLPQYSFRWFATQVLAPVLIGVLAATLVHRLVYPPTPLERAVAAAQSGFGPIRLRLRLPGTAASIPEPLVTCGVPGKAAEVYIRMLLHAQARVGIDFWGLGAVESEPFPLPSQDAIVDVVVNLPHFFPQENDPAWRQYSEPLKQLWRTHYEIAVDGVIRLKGPSQYELPAGAPIYYGANPIGGSLVSNFFTGTVLSVKRIF